jgi:hypothetical protein
MLLLVPHVLLLEFVTALPIVFRLGTLYRISALAIFAAACINTVFSTLGDTKLNFIIGAWTGIGFFNAYHLLFLVDPLEHYRHERDTVPPLELSLMRRIYWVLCAQNNLRGVGWNYQVLALLPSLAW